jgi:hypothetical protein
MPRAFPARKFVDLIPSHGAVPSYFVTTQFHIRESQTVPGRSVPGSLRGLFAQRKEHRICLFLP